MSLPHVIRLREPWEREPMARDPVAGDSLAAVRCTRRFNSPTNLDPDQRVWVVCDAVDVRAAFTLNGRRLGVIEGHRAQPRIDITESLQPHNVLAIEIEYPAESGQPIGLPGGIGEVRLEIARHLPDWQIEELDKR